MIVLSTHTHKRTHAHTLKVHYVSVCRYTFGMHVCQQRWWRWWGLWKESIVFFFFSSFFESGCISLPLHCVPEQHKRKTDPESEYEQGHNHCRYKTSAAAVSICRQASCRHPHPPQYSTSGQIELLASESTTSLEITCLICKPHWAQTGDAALYNQAKHVTRDSDGRNDDEGRMQPWAGFITWCLKFCFKHLKTVVFKNWHVYCKEVWIEDCK